MCVWVLTCRTVETGSWSWNLSICGFLKPHLPWIQLCPQPAPHVYWRTSANAVHTHTLMHAHAHTCTHTSESKPFSSKRYNYFGCVTDFIRNSFYSIFPHQRRSLLSVYCPEIELDEFALCDGKKAIFRKEFSRDWAACSDSSLNVPTWLAAGPHYPASSSSSASLGFAALSWSIESSCRRAKRSLLRVFLTTHLEENQPYFAVMPTCV